MVYPFETVKNDRLKDIMRILTYAAFYIWSFNIGSGVASFKELIFDTAIV